MEKIKKIILDEISILDSKRKRHYEVKYSNEYYLNMMFHLLKDVNNWKFLENIKGYGEYKDTIIPKYHYKTIQNKYNYWVSKNIFSNAFEKIKCDLNSNILIIDSTIINNKYGVENLTINPEYTKKQGTKLSIITNEIGFILSVQEFDINKTLKDNSKTSVHDVCMIEKTLKNVKQNNESKYYYLIGDKAYKNKYDLKLNNKKVLMITPDKKNTIIKNTIKNNKKLKKRITIEHTNLEIKKYDRCNVRKERKINNFLSWIYISSSLNNIKN